MSAPIKHDAGDDIAIRVEGVAGRITLNRPKVLNALTYEMMMAIDRALIAWAEDDSVAVVVIDGAGDRAFCSGGDVALLYERSLSGDASFSRRLWRDEYIMNTRIAEFPKPFVAIMDGVVMGGGAGVSAHGSHRVATDRTVFAMPECAIGHVPDVGVTDLLAKAPGRAGEFLGLTGARLDGPQSVAFGFADVFVPSGETDALVASVVATGDVSALKPAERPTPAAAFADAIDAAFATDDIGAAAAALRGIDAEWAIRAEKQLGAGSPLSLRVTQRLLRDARMEPGVRAATRREYRVVSRAIEKLDFLEGVRAALIDKDRSPRWRHASLNAVTQAEVDAFFEPATDGDLTFEELR